MTIHQTLIDDIRRCVQESQVHVRWQLRRDLPQVLEIDEQCFGSQAWRENDFTRTLRNCHVIALVAEIDDIVAGYVVYELGETSIQILRLGVMRAFHRCGIGTRIIERVKSKLSPYRRTKAVMSVSEHNLPAQLFLRACGFRCIGLSRFKAGDVYHFQYPCQEPKSCRKRHPNDLLPNPWTVTRPSSRFISTAVFAP